MSKSTRVTFPLIDKFCDTWPSTSLAQEWREMSDEGITNVFFFGDALLQHEHRLPLECTQSIAVIKPLVCLSE